MPKHDTLTERLLSWITALQQYRRRPVLQNESETGRLPVVFSSFQLDAFVDSTVDGCLCSVPAVFTHQPYRRRYEHLLIPREVAE